MPIIDYITDAMDPVEGDIAYFFTVFVPAPGELTNKSQCEQQAEAVIQTLRILDSIQQE